jgi:hypothetical protein
MRQDAADQVLVRHLQRGSGLLELLDVARGDALAGLDDDLAADDQVEVQGLAAQALGDQLELDAFGGHVKVLISKNSSASPRWSSPARAAAPSPAACGDGRCG